jgi:16S rRNA (cytosine967-C5)-methyltransferase
LINEINRSPVKIHPSASHPLVATLDGGSVSELGAFTRGEFYVQDESTLAAVDLLAPRKGERIADLCAAPGGKTTYAAQLMENKGQILACEVSEKRLKLVAENCARLGVTIVSTVCGDATRLVDELEPASFDGVLVDAPCTNTGVLRRRVDARWRLRETDFSRLAVQQHSLLRSAATLVRPSGRLVYSTCSLETEENENGVNEFLRQSPGFRLEESRLLFPPQSGTDGGYIALLRKSP